LNGTSRAGLAATTSDALTNRGVTVAEESNSESPYAGTVEIVTGADGLAAAFTIAELFEGATIRTDSRGGATVDVVLGANFEALRSDDEIAIDPEAPIPAATDCTPLSTASASAEEGCGEPPAPLSVRQRLHAADAGPCGDVLRTRVLHPGAPLQPRRDHRPGG